MEAEKELKPFEIILQQMGGSRFMAMTGAYNFISSGDYCLQFRFRGCRKYNWCKITLNAGNLYDVEFSQIGTTPHFVERNAIRYENIYASELQNLFTSVTGLDTHL